MTDAQAALAEMRASVDVQAALADLREVLERDINTTDGRACFACWEDFWRICTPANIAAIIAHVEAQKAENERLRAALKTCVWALRQPLDGWKGECERKALDKARDALKEQR